MSSAAKVERAKGVSYNYLTFVWNGIGAVRAAQAKGDYAEALGLISTLIPYLPDDMKNIYGARSKFILQTLTDIDTGRLAALQKITDVWVRGIMKNRIVQIFSAYALSDFVNDLSNTLNEKGYMERIETGAEGWGSTSNYPRAKGNKT